MTTGGNMAVSGEKQYLDIAQRILEEGEFTEDRTGVGTYKLFGSPQMEMDLRQGFPLLTSKKVPVSLIGSELAWMLHGDTNLQYLLEHNNHIWDEWPFVSYLKRTGQEVPEQGSDAWKAAMGDYCTRVMADTAFAAEHAELGPVYGRQWRAWEGQDGQPIDQLAIAQDTIRNNPSSRRIIVSAWNVGELEEMSESGLPPCHAFFQFNTSNRVDETTGKKYLDMKMYQRSADWFLGVPFNMAQYALLLSAMAQATDRTPRYFTHTFGDAHIYSNHVDQVKLQLSRRDELFAAPTLRLNPERTDIGSFEAEDFVIENYQHHPAIKAQVAI